MESIKEIIKNKNIELYKSHKYTLSVTGCTGYIKKEFEKEKIAAKKSQKEFNNPESEYYQMTAEQIISKWEEKGRVSCKYGTLLDEYIELKLNNKLTDIDLWKLDNNYDYDDRLQSNCIAFDNFLTNIQSKTDYEYVTREEKMYVISKDEYNVLNGRFDCLFYSKSLNKYVIIDWKSTAVIETQNNFKEKLLGPLFNYDACNANEYTIQLQMYKKALVETYGITNADNIDIFICQLHDKNYKLYKQNIEYNSDLLDKVINFACKKHVIKKN